jgi:hypothetical protein
MLVYIGFNLVGFLIFVFIFWKKLKEDYSSEIIFQSAFMILFGLLLAIAITAKITPPLFFWAGFWGGIGGLAFSILKYKLKFYETLEAFVVSVLPWVALYFLNIAVAKSSLSSFLGFIVLLLFIFTSHFLELNYRKFNWYKSGRVGFVGLAIIGFMSLTRFTLAISGVSVLSFVGKYEAVLSAVVCFISVLLLFGLGRAKK